LRRGNWPARKRWLPTPESRRWHRRPSRRRRNRAGCSRRWRWRWRRRGPCRHFRRHSLGRRSHSFGPPHPTAPVSLILGRARLLDFPRMMPPPAWHPALPSTDFDGSPRILDGDADGGYIVDMFAYEFLYLDTDSDGVIITSTPVPSCLACPSIWGARSPLWAVWLASWRALLPSREPHASHLKTSAAVMRSRSR